MGYDGGSSIHDFHFRLTTGASMDAIAFERPEWATAALILWLVIVFATVLSYLRGNLTIPQRILGFSLRGVGVGLILACLLEPSIMTLRPKPQANIVGVVVDHSQSMSTAKGIKILSTSSADRRTR